ncbi:MAG: TetR/AcrR family transcriptional regulator [Pyrinomonadaceae bacterium]|nr:TetR/AcrR family transcriptional regulator [Pyrinomonadaceae bacterium]
MNQEIKPAAQARSRATRDKLIAAFEDLLAEKYFDQITVAEIAERAGVAVGTVYRRFKNKEAFIPVMLEQQRIRQEAMLSDPKARLEISDDATLHDALRAIAHYAWKQTKKEAHVIRTLYLFARLRPEIVSEGWNILEDQGLVQIKALVDHYSDEINRTDLDKASIMIFYFFNSILIERGLFGDLSPEFLADFDEEEFADEVADFAYGYLMTED